MNGWDFLLKLAKVFLVALLAVFLSALIHADFEELEAKAETELNMADMRRADEQLLRRLYGLNGGELKNWVLYTSRDNMDVEELLLIEVSEEGQMEYVRQAAEKRAETQKSNFEGYGPEQVQLIEKYVLRESEPYILFVISKDAEVIKAEFVKGLYR